MDSSYGLRTRAVHAGADPPAQTAATTPPLVMSNTFVVDADLPFSIEDVDEAAPFIYTRWANPTVQRLEQKITALEEAEAALEEAEAALAFSSGMAAITGLLLHTLRPGDHLLISSVAYAGVIEFVHDFLPQMGITFTQVDTSDLDAVAEALRPETRLVFVETPCNPILRLTDIAGIARLAEGVGAQLAVDSTFATPVATRPLAHGAHFVVHSMTKYLGGHGDALGGIVVGRKTAIKGMRQRVGVHAGGVISPFNAWLILRGLATLPLRMKAHAEGAMQVAQMLETHPKVRQVIYPGLPSHPQHALARRQMDLFSGMLTFQVDDGPAMARHLAARLKVFHYAVSLGHHKSLIYYLDTAALQHSTFKLNTDEQRRYRTFAGDGIFRVSIGIEDPDDLCRDLDQALLD